MAAKDLPTIKRPVIACLEECFYKTTPSMRASKQSPAFKQPLYYFSFCLDAKRNKKVKDNPIAPRVLPACPQARIIGLCASDYYLKSSACCAESHTCAVFRYSVFTVKCVLILMRNKAQEKLST